MRRCLQILTFLAALTACGAAQALDAAKLDSINKAADAFITLAKDSSKTGKAPRYNDAAAKQLLDAVLNTKELEGGKPLPWEQIELLYNWNQAVNKIGVVYYLAGTGTNDVAAVAKDTQLIIRANQNTANFAPEFGVYYDAKIRLFSAMVDCAATKLATAAPDQLKDADFKNALNAVSDGTVQAIAGLLGTFVQDRLPEDWLLMRTAMLLELTPTAAKFISPEGREIIKNAAFEVAQQIQNPDVKSGVNAIARAMQMM